MSTYIIVNCRDDVSDQSASSSKYNFNIRCKNHFGHTINYRRVRGIIGDEPARAVQLLPLIARFHINEIGFLLIHTMRNYLKLYIEPDAAPVTPPRLSRRRRRRRRRKFCIGASPPPPPPANFRRAAATS
jgi:hypothetical protein